MISVKISRGGVSVSGHSGFAESGRDIVCAYVTACAEFLDTALRECGHDTEAKVDRENAAVSLRVKPDEPLVRAFVKQIKMISLQHPEFVTLEEE